MHTLDIFFQGVHYFLQIPPPRFLAVFQHPNCPHKKTRNPSTNWGKYASENNYFKKKYADVAWNFVSWDDKDGTQEDRVGAPRWDLPPIFQHTGIFFVSPNDLPKCVSLLFDLIDGVEKKWSDAHNTLTLHTPRLLCQPWPWSKVNKKNHRIILKHKSTRLCGSPDPIK